MSTVIDQRKNKFWDVDGREKLAQGNSRLSCSLNFPQNGNRVSCFRDVSELRNRSILSCGPSDGLSENTHAKHREHDTPCTETGEASSSHW